MPLAYIALGANLDDPLGQLRAALDAVAALPDSRMLRTSSFYRTAPVGAPGQPDYLNAVAALETGLAPDDLLAALLEIEHDFGRRREYRNAPRTLDLDLLLYDDAVIDRSHLQVPHPRLHLRAFVLVPLAEIAPELRLPGRGSVAAWLPAVTTQRIAKL